MRSNWGRIPAPRCKHYNDRDTKDGRRLTTLGIDRKDDENVRNLSLGPRWVYVPCMVEEGSEGAKGFAVSQRASAGFGFLHGTVGLDWRLEGCDLHHCGGEGDKCTNGKLFPVCSQCTVNISRANTLPSSLAPLGEFWKEWGGKRCSRRKKIARIVLLYVSLGEMGYTLVMECSGSVVVVVVWMIVLAFFKWSGG